MNAFQMDTNGAILAVVADSPLINIPNFNWFIVLSMALLGKILRALNVKIPSLNIYVFFAGMLLVGGLLLYIILSILCCFLCH